MAAMHTCIRHLQAVALHLLDFLEILQTAHQRPQATQRGRIGLPGAQLVHMTMAVADKQLGVEPVRLDSLQFAPGIAGDPGGIHHTDPVAQSMQVFGERLVVGSGRFHHDPGVRLRVFAQPLVDYLEALRVIVQLALGAELAVGLQGGDVEAVLGDIDTDDLEHENSSLSLQDDRHHTRSNPVNTSFHLGWAPDTVRT
ncbi:hypothetical protein GCM10027398_03450 [Azotobacter salinestris]